MFEDDSCHQDCPKPFLSLPVLVVDPWAVEQGGEEVLFRTHAPQHQADPVHGRRQEQHQSEQEAAVIGLPHAAVYPTATTTEGGRTDTHTHRQTKHRTKTQVHYETHRRNHTCTYVQEWMAGRSWN